MSVNMFNGLISVRPMSGKELKKHNKEAEEEWARLEITFTREVLFEKYEPYKILIKKGWLSPGWVKKYGRQ